MGGQNGNFDQLTGSRHQQPTNIMPKEIEIYVHTTDQHDPKLVKIPQDATVEDLLMTIAPEGHHEFHLVLEDEEETKERHQRLCDCGVHHRRHVHCHRCQQIQVSVFFNGEATRQFPPSATIGQVLKWALKAFKLSGPDATDKSLRLTSAPNEPLPETVHVGSLTKSPKCSVQLNLVDSVKTNG